MAQRGCTGGDDIAALLRKSYLNGWRLFWLISIPMSAMMVIEMLAVDLSDPRDVSHMIGYSVRWSVPFIYLVIAASALQALLPGPFPAWLLRNRKYVGLLFAVAMAWQGAFIFMMSNVYSDFYYEEIFYFRDELEGSTGYIFLAAMVVTSFRFGRRHLTPGQWRVLHLSGVYFLWAYPFSVYWWNLSYYENPVPLDYIYYWAGFLAFALRIAAWGKKRQQRALKSDPAGSVPMSLKLLGGVVIAAGLIAASTGLQWQGPVTEFLTGPAWSAELLLWLPFWPFEPFLPLMTIGLGTLLLTQVGTREPDLAVRTAD